MKKIHFLLLLLFTTVSFGQIPHCGFDFTSYLVVTVHEQGKEENIHNLKITVVDENGNEIKNTNNKYSWKNANEALVFTQNYLISKPGEKEKWFFPYSGDTYLLSVTNTFPADEFSIKVEDPSAVYQSHIVKLNAFNMYVLCSAENERQAKSFGPRTNQPIDVVLEKNL